MAGLYPSSAIQCFAKQMLLCWPKVHTLFFQWKTVNDLLLPRASKSPQMGKVRVRTISALCKHWVHYFQRTSEPNFVYGLRKSLNTVPAGLLQPLTASGKVHTIPERNHLGPGSTHQFGQPKWCAICAQATGATLSIRGTKRRGFALCQATRPQSRGHCHTHTSMPTHRARLSMEKCSHWTPPRAYFMMTVFIFPSQSINSWTDSKNNWLTLLRNELIWKY